MGQVLQIVGAQGAEGNLVLAAVAVGVAGFEGRKRLLKLLQAGRQGQLELLQPGFVDPQDVLAGLVCDVGQGGDGTAWQGDGAGDCRVLLHEGMQVGRVLGQVGRQVHQQAALQQLLGPDRVQPGLEQHLGKVRVVWLVGVERLAVAGEVTVLDELELQAAQIFHALKEAVVGPDAVAVRLLIAHEAQRTVLGGHGRHQGQEQQKGQQHDQGFAQINILRCGSFKVVTRHPAKF